MKTYENESMFVNNFAKDAKESLKNGQNFEAEVNNAGIVVSNMNNDNSSKVTIYTATIDGVAFSGSITALKKRLNISYTKEYNRTTEKAKSANTKVVIKSDEELAQTATVAAERIRQAVATINKYSDRYLIEFDVLANDGHASTDENGNATWSTAQDLIFFQLRKERDEAQKALEDKEAARKEEEAKKEAAKAELLAKIQEASASGKMSLVIDLSKELAKLTK